MDSPALNAPRPADRDWLILRWSVVALAVFSRLWWLDGRPPHFDEGVNGWFTDQMRHLGCYQYDPGNYHGPLHFYVLFLFKQLLGRNLWALRLPTAIVGIVTVEWCFRFERFLGRRTSAWAAVAMLVSPALLYFQRDAIHEAWQVFFLVLGFWGICGMCQEGARRHLWTTGLALAGMILTKETYLVHLGCLLIAAMCVFLAEILQPSRQPLVHPEEETPPALPVQPGEDPVDAAWRRSWVTLPEPTLLPAQLTRSFAPQKWTSFDLLAVAGMVVALVLFFYSGNFLYSEVSPQSGHRHWPGIEGLVTAYSQDHWTKKAEDGEGHSKPFMYWAQLVVRNEPWALLGLLAAVAYAVPAIPREWRRWRCGAIAAAALFVAWALIASGWDPVLWHTAEKPPIPYKPSILRADHLWWWASGGLVALLGMVGVAFPPRTESSLRAYGVLAAAVCVGTLCLPSVYAEPHLFTFVLIGIATVTAALSLPAPADWRVRLVAIYGLGAFLAFSIINYKTPWCIISLIWPFFFTGGALLAEMAAEVGTRGRELAMALGAAVAMLSADFAVDLNYFRPTDENFHAHPGENGSLVYVQSFDDVTVVAKYLLDAAKADPPFYRDDGVILCDSTYPLPWLLGDFEHLGYYSGTNAPASPGGYRVDFLLVSERRVDEVESRLTDDYYKQPIRLRPALEELQLYLRASRFASQMPADREPEFHPVSEAPAVPANPDMGVTIPMTPSTSPTPTEKDEDRGQAE